MQVVSIIRLVVMVHFEDKNISAYQYAECISARYNNIIKPLSYLGIDHFGYMKIFKNGSYLGLNDNIDYMQKYLSIIKNTGVFFGTDWRCLNQTKYTMVPTSIDGFSKKKDPIMHLAYDFNIWNIFCIYKFDSVDFAEVFCFATGKDKQIDSKFYLDNILLLEQFIKYFKQQAADLIDTTDQRKLAYFEERFNFDAGCTIEKHKIHAFLDKISVGDFYLLGRGGDKVALSKQELKCIKFMSFGNSMKETAKILNLSPRTVESYLNNIKLKTGYYYKSQLIKSFLDSHNIILDA
jgi:DNA-binding CsgD family transcriptional regulator